jgi:hypothetical protein
MFDMKIEDVTEDRDETKVTTTGAEYIFKKTAPGEILCYQRLGQERLVSTLTLNASLSDLTVDWKDDESCFLNVPDFRIMRVNADSLLLLSYGAPLKVTCRGNWVPEYSAVEKNNFIFVDEKGGTGVYPIPTSPNPELPELGLSFSTEGWQTSVSMQGEQRLLVSVFPPRPFDLEKSFNDRIVHYFFRESAKQWNPYPQNLEIEEYSKYGNILILHWWQKGKLTKAGMGIQSREDYIKDVIWTNFYNEALDDGELRRVIEKAHQEEMKVLPYLSPVMFPGEPEELVRETASLIEKYGFDGAYFDGISNILRGYAMMRGVRKAIGRKILYVHNPILIGNPKGNYVYCPFIDTYADYILRAEHVAARGAVPSFDWKYLRYTISGYNISNSVGFLCNYDYPPEFTRKLIPQVLKANVRLPYWAGEGWDLYVEERQRVMGSKFHPQQKTWKIMREEYFPSLNALRHKV